MKLQIHTCTLLRGSGLDFYLWPSINFSWTPLSIGKDNTCRFLRIHIYLFLWCVSFYLKWGFKIQGGAA